MGAWQGSQSAGEAHSHGIQGTVCADVGGECVSVRADLECNGSVTVLT